MLAAHRLCSNLAAALFILSLHSFGNSTPLPPNNIPPAVQPPAYSIAVVVVMCVCLTIAILGIPVAVYLILQKRQRHFDNHVHKIDSSRPHPPIYVHLDSELPLMQQVQPAYRESLTPLQKSQIPGYLPRPLPRNVPVSAAPSDVASVKTHWRGQFSGSPEELDQLAEDLAKHYVLTNHAARAAHHGHRYSISLTGRSRAYQ
ncbi:hypothetical protein MIND_00037300 [Mycena indigotica]|uniref:Uncharacterized protein n=1 Tax=Mycena indigotica TaxID=2126181 RepID=A0A8H6TDD4_9AGAR|nr:uncharacterized protein MIND_00037300 [Mycena indigotica]KAF7315229.1 hypothetical protein MIND_00037300 [Mycena indigotica]